MSNFENEEKIKNIFNDENSKKISEIEDKSSSYEFKINNNNELISENFNTNTNQHENLSNKSLNIYSKFDDKIKEFNDDLINSQNDNSITSEEEENEEEEKSFSIIQKGKKKEEEKKENNEDIIVKRFLQVQDCPILKSGIKPSLEPIKYGYCSTCDINLIHPICINCIEKCHKKYNHQVRIKK